MDNDRTPPTFYHGSFDSTFEPGKVLRPRGDAYANDWSDTDFYDILEHYRPSDKLAHKDAVFMVGDEDDIDLAGGATDVIYEVEPIGPVQKHDLNWSSEISCLMSIHGEEGRDRAEVRKAAENYWSGRPHHDENVWEYLAPAMRILEKVYDETSDLNP